MFQSTVLSLVFLLVGLQQQPADGPTRIAKELIEATRANDLSDLTWALRIEKGNTLADAIKPLQTELMRLESDTPSAVWLLRRFVAINEIYRQHVLLPAEWERLLGRLRHLDKSILMNYKAVLDSSIKNAPGSSSEVSLSAIALALIRQSNLFDGEQLNRDKNRTVLARLDTLPTAQQRGPGNLSVIGQWAYITKNDPEWAAFVLVGESSLFGGGTFQKHTFDAMIDPAVGLMRQTPH